METGAIILAAGKSRRFGAPKVLQSFRDTPFTTSIIKKLLRVGIREEHIFLIMGHHFKQIKSRLPDLGKVKIIDNPNYNYGQFSSIRRGVKELQSAGLAQAMMALIDQPHLRPSTFKQVLEAGHNSPGKIIIPTRNNRGGHPIFLPGFLFQVILKQNDKSNLRVLFKQYRTEIKRVDVDDPGLHMDTDYPEDLLKVEELYK